MENSEMNKVYNRLQGMEGLVKKGGKFKKLARMYYDVRVAWLGLIAVEAFNVSVKKKLVIELRTGGVAWKKKFKDKGELNEYLQTDEFESMMLKKFVNRLAECKVERYISLGTEVFRVVGTSINVYMYGDEWWIEWGNWNSEVEKDKSFKSFEAAMAFINSNWKTIVEARKRRYAC